MKLSDFDFDLPDDLIATRPATPRTSARLLHAEGGIRDARSEEHTSELQSPMYLVCRLLLEKKKKT